MAAPIYKQQDTVAKGVFSSNKARMTFPGSTITGVLVQGVNFNYSQQVTRLYEVDSQNDKSNVYYVGGRTQGMAQLNRVVGPSATIKEMYSEFGDVCKACKNTLVLSIEPSEADGCCSLEGIKYTLKMCALVQVGLAVNAQDMLFNETSQLMFSGCDYE